MVVAALHPVRLLALLCLVAALAAGTTVAPADAAAKTRTTLSAATPLEKAVLARINATRKAHGLAALRISTQLARAAKVHARSMGKYGYFSHTSRDGTSPTTRIRRFYSGSAVGETLLWRAPSLSATQAVKLWLASAPHRAILLSRTFREIGISAVRVSGGTGVFRGLPVTVLVADFGAR